MANGSENCRPAIAPGAREIAVQKREISQAFVGDPFLRGYCSNHRIDDLLGHILISSRSGLAGHRCQRAV